MNAYLAELNELMQTHANPNRSVSCSTLMSQGLRTFPPEVDTMVALFLMDAHKEAAHRVANELRYSTQVSI